MQCILKWKIYHDSITLKWYRAFRPMLILQYRHSTQEIIQTQTNKINLLYQKNVNLYLEPSALIFLRWILSCTGRCKHIFKVHSKHTATLYKYYTSINGITAIKLSTTNY